MALKLLEDLGYDGSSFSSKSWDVFAGADAPSLEMVITLCGSAAGETCPVWPSHPVQAHWGLPDPAACDGDEKAQYRAFAKTYLALLERVSRLLALPLDELEGADLRRALQEIGDTAMQPDWEQEV
jgi:arsenate reductase